MVATTATSSRILVQRPPDKGHPLLGWKVIFSAKNVSRVQRDNLLKPIEDSKIKLAGKKTKKHYHLNQTSLKGRPSD
jgi:hypothetical protein